MTFSICYIYSPALYIYSVIINLYTPISFNNRLYFVHVYYFHQIFTAASHFKDNAGSGSDDKNMDMALETMKRYPDLYLCALLYAGAFFSVLNLAYYHTKLVFMGRTTNEDVNK